ncbi:MAG: hypothetical protein IJ991_13460 [Thermoguttaceae bacterium]|nr:hypothetical protein [Thermoguttaceae bacterium]
MKCPKCQQENTLKNAENNAIVCAACGSRFSLPASTTSQTPPPPVDSPTAQFFHKGEQILRDGLASLQNAAHANAADSSKEKTSASFIRFLSWRGRATRKEFLIALLYHYVGLFVLGILLAPAAFICGALLNEGVEIVGGIGMLGVVAVATLGSAIPLGFVGASLARRRFVALVNGSPLSNFRSISRFSRNLQ